MSNYNVSVTLEGKDNLSDELKTASRNLDGLEKNAKNSTDGMDDLKGAALGVGAAFAAIGGIQLIGELNNLGATASATERTFVALAGGTVEADLMMRRLRESTSNTVSDMALQQNANVLLNTGLATTSEEVERLSNLGLTLGRAMGQDATEAMQNFNSAILNSSYERLDSLGLSSTKVREEVQKLQAAGMDMTSAFKSAVLNQGAAAIEKLGSSVEAAATEADILNTKLENIKETAAQGVNFAVNIVATVGNDAITSLDQLIQIFQIRGGTHPMQIAAEEQANQMAQAWSDEYMYAISQYMDKTEFDPGTGQAEAWVAAVDEAFLAVVKNPELLKNKQALMDSLLSIDPDQRDKMADAIQLAFMDKQAFTAIEQQNEAFRAQQQIDGRKAASAYVGSLVNGLKKGAGDIASLVNIFEPPSDAEVWQRRKQAIAAATDELNTFTNSYADMWPVLDVNNATDVGTLDMLLANATEELGKLQALAEQGLIPDADIEKAQGIVDNLTTMQDKITNIQGMTLDGLLGKGEGDGSLGQLAGQVMTGIDKTGMSPEQVAALQQQFDLMTGNATASSIALDEQVVPIIQQIAQDLGPEAAAQALQNVNDYLEQGNYLLLTPEQIAAGLPMATGFTQTGASGASFEVKPGESAGAAAARMGMTVEELLATTGAKDARSIRAGSYDMGPSYAAVGGFDPSQLASSMIDDTTVQAVADVQADIEQMGQDMPGITTEFTAVNTEVTTIQSVIAEMASKVHKISVELDIKGLDVLNAALGMFGGGSAGTGTSVQNNGGRVPGMDERTAT